MTGRNKKGQFIKGHKSFFTDETCEKIKKNNAKYWLGKKRPEETKEKISIKLSQYKDENALHWKGDKVKYRGLHSYISKKFGTPQFCELCETTEKRKYHWAMKEKKYSRERKDWMRLCVPCHKKYDLKK